MRDSIMAEQYIFTIDNGTQSIRALLFDTKGNLIGKGKQELEAYFSEQPGWAEQHRFSEQADHVPVPAALRDRLHLAGQLGLQQLGSGRCQQARLLAALERLALGQTVTATALDLGYDSTSAFIAMFRKALGTTPGRYFSNGTRVAF